MKRALCKAALPIVYVAARVIDLFKPMGHLEDYAGQPYMDRWHIVPAGSWASKVLKFFTGYESIRLHHIHRGDGDRDLHNHPFEYKTMILRGGYVENSLDLIDSDTETVRFIGAGEVAVGRHGIFHRIAWVPRRGVWTLFMMKENSHQWGFLVDGVYMDRRTYFREYR